MNYDFFVTRPIPEAGMSILRNTGNVDVWEKGGDTSTPPEIIIQRGKDAAVIVCLLTENITAEILHALPNIRGIANYAVGFNNIDITAASTLGIPVSNTPGVLTETTADITWALILSLARRIPEGDQFMRNGLYKIWSPALLLGRDVGPGFNRRQKTLGIVGFGSIGQAVCRRAAGFNMHVIAFDPHQKKVIDETAGVHWSDFETLLRDSDFVTLHVPLTGETHHLIGKRQLALMRSTAYLINTSRGPVVDEQALQEALANEVIAGAGLDVYENEPRMTDGLKELSNTVLLPHIGSASDDTRGEMARLAAVNAVALLQRKKAPNTVNAEVYTSPAYKQRLKTS